MTPLSLQRLGLTGCLWSLLALGGQAMGAELKLPLPPQVTLDGRLDEWRSQPTLQLDETSRVAGPAAPGSFRARVWLAQDAQGLWLAAQVQDPQVLLAARPEQVLNSDHLELWLATPAASLPPLGFINQFGEVDLHSPQDCGHSEMEDPKQCQQWYQQQQLRRQQLSRLFVRQYLLSPSGVQEAWLGPKAASLKLPPGLKPAGQSQVRYQRQAGGYSLEAHIPLRDFPAVAGPGLSGERLLVDFVDNDQGYSRQERFFSASPRRRLGDPASFLPVLPVAPEQGLPGLQSIPGQPASGPSAARLLSQPGLFFQPGNLNEVFGFYNPGIGYQYSPSADSPALASIPLPRQPFAVWQNISLFRMPSSLTLFGPGYEILALRGGKLLGQFAPESACLNVPAPQYLRPPREQSDKDGLMLGALACPTTASAFGSGTCGGCPTWFIDIFALAPDGRLVPVKSEELWDDISYRTDPELISDPMGVHLRYHISQPAPEEGQPDIEKDVDKTFPWSAYLNLARQSLIQNPGKSRPGN